jgi:hypothetical protein
MDDVFLLIVCEQAAIMRSSKPRAGVRALAAAYLLSVICGIQMPTNIVEVLERRRRAQFEASADTTMLLVYLIASLCVIILQLAVPNFADALVLIGQN